MTSLRLDILLLRVLCLLLAVTAGSCSHLYDFEGPCEQDTAADRGDRISFKFRIYTDEVKARSRALGVWEESPANVAERILNPQDMRILVLDVDGDLIRSVKPAVLEYKEGEGITGDGYYEIAASFEDENLDKLDEDALVTFRLMIFANINSIGGVYITDAMLPGALFENLQETFTMSPGWYPSSTGGIPMFGYMNNNVSVRKADLMNYGGVDLGAITMQRAMCKVEVSDKVINAKPNTADPDDKHVYPYVKSVKMISWRNIGNLRPSNLNYNNLKTANIPNPTGPAATTPVTAHYDDGKGVFRLYCPEAHLQDMKFSVEAVLAPGEDPKSFEVGLAQYIDDGTTFGSDMVRNHIYRFEVLSFNTIADLKLRVVPWVAKVDEYTLDDIVVMDRDGFLTWTNVDGNPDFAISTEQYNGKEEMQLSMLNGTTDYATATFHITSPKGAVWRASFIPGENGIDAFEFVDVDADGNVIAGSGRSVVEGTVGEPATIHLRGKGEADNYRHTAELVVEVHQPDGSVIYAPLNVDNNSSRYIIFREDKL